MEHIPPHPEFIKVESFKQLEQKNIRLFYELGYKRNSSKGVEDGNWIRTGEFKEIKDIEKLLKYDGRLHDLNYIKHHNFQILKK